jgi:hypothetical protein
LQAACECGAEGFPKIPATTQAKNLLLTTATQAQSKGLPTTQAGDYFFPHHSAQPGYAGGCRSSISTSTSAPNTHYETTSWSTKEEDDDEEATRWTLDSWN